MRFTLRQLTVFAALARTAHFGNAADVLQLSQPTVSADIKALERALKVVLFHRSRAGATLTEAGQKLLPYAQATLENAEQLNQAGQVAAAERDHRIRLAATPSLVNRLVPSLLQELANGPGNLQVEAMEVPTGGVGAAIASGEADVGIGHFVAAPHGCSRATISYSELWLLAEAGKLTLETPSSLAPMKGRKVVIWPRDQNPEYYDVLMEACRQRDFTPVTQEGPLRIPGAYSYLLTSGKAFALVPGDYARDAPASLSCAPLSPPARLPLHAVWRLPLTPGVSELIETLRQVQRSLLTV